MLLDVIAVSVQPDYSLLLDVENGERRLFNMMPYIDQKPLAQLKYGNSFQGAFVENGTVTWPGNVDIEPETLHELSASLDMSLAK